MSSLPLLVAKLRKTAPCLCLQSLTDAVVFGTVPGCNGTRRAGTTHQQLHASGCVPEVEIYIVEYEYERADMDISLIVPSCFQLGSFLV